MAEKIELKGRIGKDYWGHLFFETDPPNWKFKAMSKKITGAGYMVGQEVKVTIESVKQDKADAKKDH